MKYIVTETKEGTEDIFIFPNTVNHDCMAEVLCYIKDQSWGDWERVYRKPIAAGFTDGELCWGGEVETLV